MYSAYMYRKKRFDWSGIRTHAPEETGALIQRLRPLGHPVINIKKYLIQPKNFPPIFSKLNSKKKKAKFPKVENW